MKIQIAGIFGIIVLMVLIGCGGEAKKETPEAKPQNAVKDGDGFALEAGKVKFNWCVEADKMKVKLCGPTAGWVGLGFNPGEQMKDANFYIGYVKDAEVKVIDHHGTSKRLHKEDASLGGKNDVTDVTGKEENNTTEVSFTIPLNTEDSLDKEIKLQQDITVLLAYGKTDRMSQQHAQNATLKLNLSTGVFTVLKISK